MESQEQKNIAQLWKDYLFLTNELIKFLDKKDFDMFNELLRQRETLQEIINEVPEEKEFRTSPQSKSYFSEIFRQNQIIKQKLEFQCNMAKRQNQVSLAYENFNSSLVGKRMDTQL